MGKVSVCVRILAFYLVGISVLGTISQLWFFITSVLIKSQENTYSSELFTNTNTNSDFGNSSSEEEDVAYYISSAEAEVKTGNETFISISPFLQSALLLYKQTFPVVSPIVSTDINSSQQYSFDFQPEDFSTCAILVTLLPSILLLRGTYKLDYSNCQFWYFTQVSSVLLSCIKITVITCAGLWDAVTNAALISTLFGLAQVVLVQNFMESLQRAKTRQMRNKYHFHLLSANDLELKSKKTGGSGNSGDAVGNKTEGKSLTLNNIV
ncbi:unnamed protein product [Orchesella dallaii]|uniref:Transmembrane protein n=1 Tax=Orchesella dallaii TaxID=48710 RepID=A0ABP1QIC7_9HEXA